MKSTIPLNLIDNGILESQEKKQKFGIEYFLICFFYVAHEMMISGRQGLQEGCTAQSAATD